MLDFSAELPDLPRVLKKREAGITPRIAKWLEVNWKNPYVYEIKIKGNTTESHQRRDLNKAVRGRASWKLSDATVGKLPFDGFGAGKKGMDALVITYDPKKKGVILVEVINTGTLTEYTL